MAYINGNNDFLIALKGDKGERGERGDKGEGIDDVLAVLPVEMREPINAVYDAGLTQGTLNGDGSEGDSTNRVRTGYIPVGRGIVGSFSAGSTRSYGTRVYDAEKVFLGVAYANANGVWDTGNSWGKNPCVVDNITKIYPSAMYVRFFFDTGTMDAVDMVFTYPSLGGLNGITLDEVYGHTTKQPYKDYDIPLFYTIDDEGHYTKGFLKLPPNYVNTGEAVPLIVFVHASNYFSGLNASSMVVDYYEPYYNYLRDCGYAIFDCYGWGNVYAYAKNECSTWGTPTNNKCYIKGIEYVCKHYNIDPDNIFVTTKSLGGIQALSLCYQNEVKIKACGMLAPELDMLVPAPFGYTQNVRVAIATDLGFTGDWESILNVDNGVYDRTAGKAYLRTQADKLASINPIYKSVLLPTESKIDFSIGGNYDMSAFRLCNVPIKVWGAPDDTAIRYTQLEYLIATLKNAGCDGELRTMPAGTGGHQAVDRNENALQTANVTTRLGVYYETVPTAFYELEQYFAKFAFKAKSV